VKQAGEGEGRREKEKEKEKEKEENLDRIPGLELATDSTVFLILHSR